MYAVTPYRVEIRLISNLNGLVGVYPDYESFLDSLTADWIRNRLVTTFKDWPEVGWWKMWSPPEPYERFVVRDKFGSVFSSEEIAHDFFERKYAKSYSWKYFLRRENYIYRETPVPWTGKTIRGFYNWYKRPKTTQERRWGYADPEYVRPRRRPHLLPNTWDDQLRGDRRNRRCWKNKKIKRQWMKNLGR